MGPASFIESLTWVYLFGTYHHRGWYWWLMKKMGYMEQTMWNSFHVLTIKQRVEFCLCRTFGEFLVEFTKYNFIILGYVHLDKLVHEELHHITWLSTNEHLYRFSFSDDLIWAWLNYGRRLKEEWYLCWSPSLKKQWFLWFVLVKSFLIIYGCVFDFFFFFTYLRPPLTWNPRSVPTLRESINISH